MLSFVIVMPIIVLMLWRNTMVFYLSPTLKPLGWDANPSYNLKLPGFALQVSLQAFKIAQPIATNHFEKAMNKYNATNLMVALVCIFLSGCQISPKPEPTAAEQPDPDIVVMPGFGDSEVSSSLVGVKPMTFEELEKCGTKLVNLKKESAQSQADNRKLSIQKAELDKQYQSTEVERSKVNVASTKQVDNFNKLVNQNRKLISQYNNSVNAHNSKASAIVIQTNDFNTFCASRSYRQSDFNRLPPDISTAIASNSEISDIPLIEEAVQSNSSVKKQIHIPASPRHQ